MRRRIDEDAGSGNMISDGEIRRMAELDRIAAMGTEDEQLLHRLAMLADSSSPNAYPRSAQCGFAVNALRAMRGFLRVACRYCMYYNVRLFSCSLLLVAA